MKNIYLIVGPSGVGKTTLVEKLAKEHSLRQVESYTTRPRRYPDETGHLFVTDSEFDRLGTMVAYTEYNGFKYGVTSEIINAHDLYVIDPFGVQFMLERYHGPKGVVVIGLVADRDELCARMKQRGDTKEAIEKRLNVDVTAFDYNRYNFTFDFMLHADGIEETAKAVYEYISFRERHDPSVQIFQINCKRDDNRVMFSNVKYLERIGQVKDGHPWVNFEIYDRVWSGDLEFRSVDDIFRKFNADDRPNPTSMRSLSVSDLVLIDRHDDDKENLNGIWYCDSFGWRRVGMNGIIW